MMIGMGAQVTDLAMGTVMSHKAFGVHAEECLAAVCEEVCRLEGILSRFLPESDISRINRSAGIQSEMVSFDTCEILAEAAGLSRLCPGCFDITVGPLVALWSRAQKASTPPDASGIRRVLSLVNDQELDLDLRRSTAGLKRKGQSIDLGGIGKGYAGDRILEVYREYGITSAYSNLGGNVVTLGNKPDGSPWRVGIQHPRQEDQLIGTVAVSEQTVVTSGDYQRCFTDSRGMKYHHILNPATGCPANSGLISVTIVSARSLAADALSTMLFVAGLEKGLQILKSYPQTGAILVDSAMRVYVTHDLRYRFQAAQDIQMTILD